MKLLAFVDDQNKIERDYDGTYPDGSVVIHVTKNGETTKTSFPTEWNNSTGVLAVNEYIDEVICSFLSKDKVPHLGTRKNQYGVEFLTTNPECQAVSAELSKSLWEQGGGRLTYCRTFLREDNTLGFA